MGGVWPPRKVGVLSNSVQVAGWRLRVAQWVESAQGRDRAGQPLRRWEGASRGTKSVGRHSEGEESCLFVRQEQESGGECPRKTAVPLGVIRPIR